jgi:hypothetical protein
MMCGCDGEWYSCDASFYILTAIRLPAGTKKKRLLYFFGRYIHLAGTKIVRIMCCYMHRICE